MNVRTDLTFEDLLVVSYAVPPERVRPLVPPSLALDTFVGADGEPQALVSAVAFRLRRAESGGLAIPLDAPQLNVRTYVQPTGRCLYFIRIELGVRPFGMLGEIALRGAAPAPIAILTDYDEAAQRYRGYELYCHSPAGDVELTVSQSAEHTDPPAGFASWSDAAAFIVDRPVGFATSTVGGYVRLDVEHGPLRPDVGHLDQGRLRSLERLGIVSRDEATRPHSVLLKRRAVFSVRPPRPILVPSGLRG